MSQIYIDNAFVITMDGRRTVYDGGGVLVENDRIKAVGKIDPALVASGAERLDAAGRIVMPGLINTHVHLSQQLGRGMGDDVSLLTWLHERTFPYESAMTEEDSYRSSMACIAEQIKCGVTTFAEPGGQEVDGMGRAASEAGIRGILARSTMDCGDGLPQKFRETTDECLAIQEENIKNWHNAADGRIRVWFGLRTLFNNSDELVKRTKALADKYGVGIHMHVAEVPDEVAFTKATRGASPVELLGKLGALGENMLAAHSVWLTDNEIDLFLLHGVKVTHNPAAAMRVLGFARIPEMLAKGICVSIGTDGAPSNNRMDLIDEMYLTSLIHKGRTLDPSAVPAEKVLEMVTRDAAKCLLWDDELGSLEPGKKADLAIINLRNVSSLPVHDPISNLVYANKSTNVEYTMADGRWLMKERALTTIDEQELLDATQNAATDLLKRAGIKLRDRFPIMKCAD